MYDSLLYSNKFYIDIHFFWTRSLENWRLNDISFYSTRFFYVKNFYKI